VTENVKYGMQEVEEVGGLEELEKEISRRARLYKNSSS